LSKDDDVGDDVDDDDDEDKLNRNITKTV
jgi:hypothetical protein